MPADRGVNGRVREVDNGVQSGRERYRAEPPIPVTASSGRSLQVIRAAIVLGGAVGVTAMAGAAVALLRIRDVGELALLAATASVAIAVSAGRPRVLVLIGSIAYVVALQWTYLEWIVPIWGYSGLIEVGVEGPSLVVVTILAALPGTWLPVRLEKPSTVILWFLYLFAYVPSVVVPVHLLGPDISAVLPLEIVLLVAFGVLGLVHRVPRVSLGGGAIKEARFTRLVVIIGLAAVPYLLLVFGLAAPPALEDVYARRATYQSVLNASLGSGYFVTWLGNIVYPLLMALGMARSRHSLLILGISGQILIYAASGLKEMLLSVVFVPLLYLTIRHGSRMFGPIVLWGAVSVLAVSIATAAAGSTLALALFVTRMIVLPGQLTAYYYDFFTSHETYMLSHSFLRWIVSAPYDIEPPFLIGRIYLHAAVDANANIWADAMANFGLLGVVPFTLILGFVLWLLDSAAVGRDVGVIGSILGLAGLALANGALFTSLLTAGIGLTIAVVVVMPRGLLRGSTSVLGAGP